VELLIIDLVLVFFFFINITLRKIMGGGAATPLTPFVGTTVTGKFSK
jgi:hypothetical protein